MARAIILLLEDHVDDAFLTHRTIIGDKLAHEIVVVKDGVEAIEYLFGNGSSAPKPLCRRLSCSIWKLPGMSGPAALKRVRTEPLTKHLTVIVVTSPKENRDKAESHGNGANSYLQKPLYAQTLRFAIDDLKQEQSA